MPGIVVALRKESVDRNTAIGYVMAESRLSLSARRAWIEIRCMQCFFRWSRVALRKESVDRNDIRYTTSTRPSMSLSARRAWIEIVMQEIAQQRKQRSLSARRAWIEICLPIE